MGDIMQKSMMEIRLNELPISDEIPLWIEKGRFLRKEIREYNWEYRKKICMNCNEEKRKKLDCMAFENFRDNIKETHCKNLGNARAKKFKNEMNALVNSHPLLKMRDSV